MASVYTLSLVPEPPLSFLIAHASDLQEGMGRIEQEQYEEAVAAHGDSVFYKLQKRLARMPTQVQETRPAS